MGDLVIEEVDPFDAAAFDAWHAAYFAGDSFGRQGAQSPWQLEEARIDKQADHPHLEVTVCSGIVDGDVVCAGEIRLPLLDNLDLAVVGVWTRPQHRRLGHGSAMLAHLEMLARGRGRTVLSAEAAYPYELPADGAGHPNAEFLVRRGFRYGLGDVNRRLGLPVPAELLERLTAEAAPHHTAYTLESFAGPVPESYAEGVTALSAALPVEAPTGELQREAETPDVAVLRSVERTIELQGRTKYTTVALDAAGAVVGFTELLTSRHEPGRVYQWGTLVRGQHRGHRLGLALKVANLAFLQSERPDARLVTTYNAEVNTHMIGVNERLGFRPVERLGEFQKRI